MGLGDAGGGRAPGPPPPPPPSRGPPTPGATRGARSRSRRRHPPLGSRCRAVCLPNVAGTAALAFPAPGHRGLRLTLHATSPKATRRWRLWARPGRELARPAVCMSPPLPSTAMRQNPWADPQARCPGPELPGTSVLRPIPRSPFPAAHTPGPWGTRTLLAAPADGMTVVTL